MKKNIITITALIIAIAIAITCGFAIIKNINKTNAHTRTCAGTVVEVAGDVVVVETEDGNIWEFYGEGYTAGQQVKILFSNNGSPNFAKDDTIQKVWEA